MPSFQLTDQLEGFPWTEAQWAHFIVLVFETITNTLQYRQVEPFGLWQCTSECSVGFSLAALHICSVVSPVAWGLSASLAAVTILLWRSHLKGSVLRGTCPCLSVSVRVQCLGIRGFCSFLYRNVAQFHHWCLFYYFSLPLLSIRLQGVKAEPCPFFLYCYEGLGCGRCSVNVFSTIHLK